MWFACDTHVHTSFSSDCSTAPEEVATAAAARGVGLLAITDHHDVRGWRPAWKAARGTVVLPGVELTCADGRSAVHVIGLFRRDKRFDEERFIDVLELESAGLGKHDGSVPYGVAEAVERIHSLGGLAVAAHAASARGLLRECEGPALARIVAACRFDAIEIQGARDPWRRPRVPEGLNGIEIISGSDAHHVEDRPGASHPHGVGARPYWAYMHNGASFPALSFALSPGGDPGMPLAGVISPLLSWTGKARVDALLRLPEYFFDAVPDDRTFEHRTKIIDAVVRLLNSGGGHVLVGARRRFENRATRGADLRYTADQLIDFVCERINPTPIVHGATHRGKHGPMQELIVLPGENTAGRYVRAPRGVDLSRVLADRAALERLGVFDAKVLAGRLRERAGHGPLGLDELVRMFGHRDWFVDDKEIRDVVADALAHHILTRDEVPRWIIQWAKELDRARLATRTAYRELVKRDAGREHRARIREAIIERVTDRAERRRAEQWFETAQGRVQEGKPLFDDPTIDAPTARERARRALGEDIAGQLDAEAEKATAQYDAAIKGAFGALAEPVVHTGAADVDLELLDRLGIAKIILAGAGGEGEAIAVPDPMARMGADDLINVWAADDMPDRTRIPDVVRRAVESGTHLPILRFAAQLDRGGIERLVDELDADRVGAKQNRNYILADLRSCLEAPDPAPPVPAPVAVVVADLLDEITPESLRAAADAALRDGSAVAAALKEHHELVAEIQAHAEPGISPTWRRPAVVLAGCLEDWDVLNWWDEETNHQVRIDLVNALSLLPGDDEDVDAALEEALQSRGSVAAGAGRALAARGPAGYDVLFKALPTTATPRSYVLRGVAKVADRHPALARSLAVQAAREPAVGVYAAIRDIDRALHLQLARQAAAGARPLQTVRRRHPRLATERRAGA